jgi:hypothetical protein
MRSYTILAVLALAASALSIPAPTPAPTQYGYGNLLVEFKRLALPNK